MAKPPHRLEKNKMTNIVTKTNITHTEPNGSTYNITYGFSKVNGRLEVAEVNIKPLEIDGIVTQKVLRSISPAEATRKVRLEEKKNTVSDFLPLMQKWENSPDQLETIARLYREAYSTGTPIEKHIAQRVGRPLSTVNRWIGYARKSGHLRPAKSTRGGEATDSL